MLRLGSKMLVNSCIHLHKKIHPKNKDTCLFYCGLLHLFYLHASDSCCPRAPQPHSYSSDTWWFWSRDETTQHCYKILKMLFYCSPHLSRGNMMQSPWQRTQEHRLWQWADICECSRGRSPPPPSLWWVSPGICVSCPPDTLPTEKS